MAALQENLQPWHLHHVPTPGPTLADYPNESTIDLAWTNASAATAGTTESYFIIIIIDHLPVWLRIDQWRQ